MKSRDVSALPDRPADAPPARESPATLGLARLAAAGALLLAVTVLAGWALDHPLLRLALPNQVAMKANAALSIGLIGLAVWLLADPAESPGRRRIARICALAAAALGAASLGEYLLGIDLGIDQVLFREPAGAFGTSHPGRMAPLTAVCLMLMGTATVGMARPRFVPAAQALAVLAAMIGLFNLIGHLFGVATLYRVGHYTPMAVPTAGALLALGLGLLCARPEAGLMRTLTSGAAGGVIARRLLPWAVVLPVTLGWLQTQGLRLGLIEQAYSEALISLLNGFLLVVAIWWIARLLERGEDERRRARDEYRTILETAIDGFWLVDHEGRLLEVNDAYCRMSGYSRDELLRRRIPDLEAAESSEDTRRHIERVLAQGSDRFETRHRRKDGSIFPVEINVQHLSARGGIFFCFLQDITRRKQAEEILRETNQRLEQGVRERTQALQEANESLRLQGSALESAANAIIITDRAGLIEWVNPAFCALSGYTAAEAVGRNPRELVKSGRHDAAFFRQLWATILTGKVWQSETVNRRKDGSLYTEFQTITPVKDEHGAISHFIAVKEDITERKHAEARIRYLNRIYATLSAVNRTIVRERDPQEVFAAACRIAVEKGGFRLAWIGLVDLQTNTWTVAGRKCADRNYLDRLTLAAGGNSAEAGLAGEAWRTGAPAICNDIGTDPRAARWRAEALLLGMHSTAAFPLKAGGRTIGTLALYAGEAGFFDENELLLLDEIAADLAFAVEIHGRETDRRQAAARIHEQAEVIDQSPVAIVLTDLSHRVTYCNAGALRLYGLTREELLGHAADELFSAETMRHLGPGRSATLATGSWQGEVPIHTRDGRSIIVEFFMSLIRDDQGRPKARLSIAVDITEKKQMEEQMQRMQRLENLGMLSAGIAHDFNNALAPIFMAGPMLRGHLHDPGGRHILDVMEKSAERSVALVRQLLTFARGSATGRQSLEVRQVTQEVLELAESTFPKSIRLARDLPAGLWPVQGNPTQLHQVFLNLCVNARDAMPQGGELKLTAANCTLDSATAAGMPDAHPGDFVRVEVRDTGTGIPPEVLARIWEPFYTTKGEGKGTGLGLSTVRGLLHQHEGFATVQTQAGHGTAFTVYLPAARGAAETEGAAEAASPARGNGELVLVVDDEELVCELVGTILTAHGYRTLTAGDGAAAIAVFATRAAEVRLLLTDLQMPLLGGPALATALRRMNPNLPIIAMSGADSRSDTAHREFTSAFLAKPFQPETLLSIVRRTLDAARPPAA